MNLNWSAELTIWSWKTFENVPTFYKPPVNQVELDIDWSKIASKRERERDDANVDAVDGENKNKKRRRGDY